LNLAKSVDIMSLLFVLRRIFLITLLVLPQRYWLGRGWRSATALRPKSLKWTVRAFLVLAGVAMVAVLTDRIFHKFLSPTVSPWIAPIIQLWIFTSTFTFFCVKTVHAVGWCWSRLARLFENAGQTSPRDPSRRSLMRMVASFVGAVPFLAALYGFARERLQFEIVKVDITFPGLHPNLDGLTIVQLSDIHVGDFMPLEEVRRAVEMANGLGAHLGVITGDFVTSAGDPLAECIAELGRLIAPLGVWGCNGNHEIYAGAEDEAEVLFRQHGMQLLRQSATQINWNGASLNLIGVDYQRSVQITGSVMPTLGGAESLVRRDIPNILLSHNPNTFYSAAELGIELSLAGHTHGGQVNIEIVNHSWSPARFMTRFVAGLYQLPMGQKADTSDGKSNHLASLYVNRGLGTLGVPARIGANPEITLLTLRSTSLA
jgi:predicted MPP superfamily phosphohydrolase